MTDACLLLPAGWLADRSGHHRVFVLGLALTAAAFLLCGGAPAFGWLLGGRVLQGVGAALIFGSAPALVTLASRDAERQRALGWFNLAFGAGAVLGPLAGGALVTAWGWRAVYLTRLPLALAALVLVWRARPRELPGPTRMEAPPTAHAVADRRTFVVANAVNVLANGALFFVWLLVPYYLLERRGLGAGPGGVLFAAGALATALGAPAGGLWADRRGARRLVPVALGAEAVGLLLTSRLDATSSPVAIALALLLAGGGVGLFAAPNMHYVMGVLPRARQGWAGSLVVLMRRGGIVAGAGLATFVYEGRLALYRGLGAAEADATARAFTDAFLVASAIAATAAGLSLIPPAVRRDRLGASKGRI